MDDEFDQAAKKHKLRQRQGAIRAQQRKRQTDEAALRPLCSWATDGYTGGASPSGGGQLSPCIGGASAVVVGGATSSTVAAIVDESDGEVACPGGPFTCFICTQAKGADERFLPHRCSGERLDSMMCCRPCFVAWVESQIDNNAANIKCCHCDEVLETRALSRLIGSQHMMLYADTMTKRSLRQDPAFIWCSKCPAGGWIDKSQPISKCGWSCPECSNSFVYCPHCRREHGTLPCKRFQQLRREIVFGEKKGADSTQSKQSEGVVQRSSKMCPSCQMPIQKDGGCKFMDCPNCRRHFCWACGRILRGSHQDHKCDATFEGSTVVAKTQSGRACVELTRLYVNVLDVDNMELCNTDPEDLDDLREMLVPRVAASEEVAQAPRFVGPSACDGEVVLRLPFNFRKAISWEITHIVLRASHPPAPGCRAPRSMGLRPNMPSASFSDFEDATTVKVPLQDIGNGLFVAELEQFRVKGTFKRVTSLALRLSVEACDAGDEDVDSDYVDEEVFFNGMSIFGLPGETTGRNPFYRHDGEGDLIVSPVLNRTWGTRAETDEGAAPPVQDGD